MEDGCSLIGRGSPQLLLTVVTPGLLPPPAEVRRHPLGAAGRKPTVGTEGGAWHRLQQPSQGLLGVFLVLLLTLIPALGQPTPIPSPLTLSDNHHSIGGCFNAFSVTLNWPALS